MILNNPVWNQIKENINLIKEAVCNTCLLFLSSIFLILYIFNWYIYAIILQLGIKRRWCNKLPRQSNMSKL